MEQQRRAAVRCIIYFHGVLAAVLAAVLVNDFLHEESCMDVCFFTWDTRSEVSSLAGVAVQAAVGIFVALWLLRRWPRAFGLREPSNVASAAWGGLLAALASLFAAVPCCVLACLTGELGY